MGDGLIDRPTAQVSGYPAKVLGTFLRDAVRGQLGVFGRLPEEHRAEVLAAVNAIWRAGMAWAVDVDADVDAMSVRGRADIAAEMDGARFEQIDAKEVARMLRVTERQARRLGPDLGVQIGGRWYFDVDAVRAEQQRRSIAS